MLNHLLLKGPRSAAYALCAVVCMLFALVGIEYGAFYFYFIPTLLCAVQFARPTLVGWGLIFALVSASSVLWIYLLAKDIYLMSGGSQPNVLVDFNDSWAFGSLAVLSVVLAVWLFFVRPGKNVRV